MAMQSEMQVECLNSNEILSLHSHVINEQTCDTVNARELHTFLEIGRDFSNWIKARIKQYLFVENEDFICVENLSSPKRASANLSSPERGSSKSRVQKVKDYFITLDMAKELAMVERNDKGRQARRYFIDCERQLKNTTPAITDSQDTDKLQLLNTMVRSMKLRQPVVIIPQADAMDMVRLIRGYQIQISQLQKHPVWVDGVINNIKQATGLTLGE